ncbi:hypothetical protein AX16_009294 [Volvariella volvacea WC 439]|nr:hypothetical protein AX16_009294 [Volvariella volvacea WC 439]
METAEPRLPQELERIVFLIAAHNDRQKTLPALMLVARRVRHWLQDIVYDTVILGELGFYRDSRSPIHQPPRFPAGPQTLHVRNFLITNSHQKDSEPNWVYLLQKCHNIENFAMWCYINDGLDVLSLLTSAIHSPLRTVVPHGLLRLSASLMDLFPDARVDFNHPILKDVTHLESLDFLGELEGRWVDGNNYACMPNLRYLFIFSFECDVLRFFEVLGRLLEECKTLELLILPDNVDDVQIHVDALLQRTRRIVQLDGTVEHVQEDRVVIYRGPFTPRGVTEDWYEGATGNDDMWTHSEKILLRRRRRRELEMLSWGSLVDSDADVDIGEWLSALERR